MYRGSRVATLLVGSVIACAITAAPAQAQGVVQPYGTNDAGGFRDVLPPGTNGLVNPFQLIQYEANGARPMHNDDQLAMYRDLVFAAPGLKPADLPKFFKDATFGVKPEDIASEESPEPGVTIIRDRQFGVPHIYGDTRPALMFGIGYATAEDRLFFIDVLRHLGKGQLTSFAGGAPGNRDFDAMQWGIAPYTDADLQRQINEGIARAGPVGAQINEDADNYVAGINAYITQAKLNPNLMPGEYAALNQPQGPDPFTKPDLVAIASLVGGIFGAGGGGELGNAQLYQSFLARFGPKRGPQYFGDFTGIDDPETPTTVHGTRFPYQLPPAKIAAGSVAMPDPGSIHPNKLQTVTGGGTAASGVAKPALSLLPHAMSNALLVSSRLSQSGHPLAVFGPQTGYFAPQILMEQDIHGPGIDAAGAAFPGVNLYVELGHGRDYAWSATSAGQDITDTFALPLCNPDGSTPTLDSTSYVLAGQCQPMEKIERVNQWSPNVADQTPAGTETLTAYRTKMGLLIARATVGGKPVAYVSDRSTYLHELDSALGFEQFNDPAAIRDARDFQLAASQIGYTFNWFYIDSQRIAYFNSGQDPVRPPGVDPRFPTWSQFPWKGFDPNTNLSQYLPFDAHPQVIDQDYLTSWNNKQAPGSGLDGSPIYRSQPLDDGILARTRGGHKLVLTDLVDAMENAATIDLRADKVLPYALRVLGTPSDPAQAKAATELQAWLAAGAHRKSPAPGKPYGYPDAIRIFDAWWPRLVKAVFAPGLGDALFKQVGITGDDTPEGGGAHHGSSWQSDNYGRVQKDLREVLGLPVRGRYRRVWCGGGKLAACRAALQASLGEAAAEPANKTYPGDGDCVAGDQTCWDSIEFFPLGAVHQPLIPWQNRPTFQQADEIQGHRPFPARPACIYRLAPAVRILGASSDGRIVRLAGSATPRDCGDGQAKIASVRVAIVRLGRLVTLRVHGTRRWTARSRRSLRAGRYTATVTATDRAGNVARASRRIVIAR
jgi:acyl-homoserine lactone acylase PvdQ